CHTPSAFTVNNMPELKNDYRRLSAAAKEYLFRDQLMVIDGMQVASASGEMIAVTDPSNNERVGRVPAASADDVDRAVGAARRAFDEGPWKDMTAGDRERLLLKLADLVERDRMMLAEIEVVESGRLFGAVQA